jgi:S1-C subfamily serine protease
MVSLRGGDIAEETRRTQPVEGPVRFKPLRLVFWLCVLLLMLLTMRWVERDAATGLDPEARPLPVAPVGKRSADEETNIQIYERTSPSVVQVTSLKQETDSFSLNVERVPKGVGSGFVWDKEGHIVTNYHVVDGADGVRVTLADHSTYDARQIWADPEQDIAVVWIVPKGPLHPVVVGTSHDLKVGQVVYSLGDPFGLDQTMTTGIVSALGREIEGSNGRRIGGVIQTSAAINPGNSGGPLFDTSGRLIGMNTAILSPSGAFAGIGFAIPVDEINQIVPQLIRNGKVVHPRLGVQIADDQLARQLGVDQGALIVKVVPNSPAAQANLRETRRSASGSIELGDVIVALNGHPIANADELRSALGQSKPGSTQTLTIRRDGRNEDVRVTLPTTEQQAQ